MKLFGKKKNKLKGEASSPQEEQTEGEVVSYFSEQPTKVKKQNNEHHDISKLLDMEPSSLNSKQKRVIRRYKEREGLMSKGDSHVEKNQSETNDVTEFISIKDKQEKNDDSQAKMSHEEDPVTLFYDEDIEKRMNGLNSKERRKFLRQLAADDSEGAKLFLAKATEAAKRIAEENEAKHVSMKQDNTKKQKDEERIQVQKQNNDLCASSTVANSRKRKVSDLSHLSPEERERRENQRRMQQEAKIRRENGEEDLSRHPLNSERRRANRRKPGKTGKLAKFLKEKKQEQRALNDFNAGGYRIRHQKK